jgi:hypothetical protein
LIRRVTALNGVVFEKIKYSKYANPNSAAPGTPVSDPANSVAMNRPQKNAKIAKISFYCAFFAFSCGCSGIIRRD